MSLMHKEFMMLAEDLEKTACIHLTEETERIKKIPIVWKDWNWKYQTKAEAKFMKLWNERKLQRIYLLWEDEEKKFYDEVMKK